jgi:hypothetical protein
MPDHDPGQLTTRQLDRYAGQLARCLKALGTDAPIRADVQRELAIVRAEQESRASPGPAPGCPVAGTTARSAQ